MMRPTGRRSIWIGFWMSTAILPHRCRLKGQMRRPQSEPHDARNFLFQMEQNSRAAFALT